MNKIGQRDQAVSENKMDLRRETLQHVCALRRITLLEDMIVGVLLNFSFACLFLCLHKVKVKAAQSCPTLCNQLDCNLPSSSVHGILQVRILEWMLCPPLRNLPDPEIEPTSPMSPALAGVLFTTAPPRKPHYGPKLGIN